MLGIARQAGFGALAAVRANPSAHAAALGQIALPQPVVDWLVRLATLADVPLVHVVADPALLPPESIRFFRVDRDWITALIEGACSIGRACSSDAQDDARLVVQLRDAVLAGVPEASGFLLRSAVLDGWPGLEVAAYAADDVPLTQTPLRHELIAPGILLFMVPGTIARVDLHEPAEGLHFGVAHDHTDKSLRDTQGQAIPASAKVSYRGDGCVMRIADLETEIAPKVPGYVKGSAGFALQLVQGVQSWRFDIA